ncbi:MAG: rhomboid family intramembrane serine protease [Rubrobacteraceae bacterium]|uniref:rhomboid family intramembrane serine protease n=1 Tax=Rubrobacter calidifluminis TaxID=1392640 RepID=UPI0023630615|nr:rhomboid family intramembrane serine protease [Rubrobacter calidifluminis]MBX6765302.1 rhomboid family intramembrane serine protease [Rubrobacteraceae bacterium]
MLATQPPQILQLGELRPALVARGQLYRMLTSMFLHAGMTHIALNMVSLYFLGSFAEPSFGRARYLAMYFLSGLASGIAYLYFGGFDTAVVGASGAIFGLVGGILGYALRRGAFSWENPIVRQLIVLTALNLWIGFSIPHISNTAHIGGLAGGALYGWLMAPSLYSSKPGRAIAPVATVLGIELLLLGLWLFST